jgi:hypothetical protein
MKVSDLMAQLQPMPTELEELLPCEAGQDHATGVGIVQVVKTKFDGPGTPVGNYRVMDGYEPELQTGQVFPVAVIDYGEFTRQP